jgi:hypothetical protein
MQLLFDSANTAAQYFVNNNVNLADYSISIHHFQTIVCAVIDPPLSRGATSQRIRLRYLPKCINYRIDSLRDLQKKVGKIKDIVNILKTPKAL